MSKLLFALSLGIGGLIWATQHAQAQTPVCGDRTAIVERLLSSFGEVRQSVGLRGNNSLLEVFATDDGGSWTILITAPNGRSCIVAAGQAWENMAAKPPGQDA